MRQRILNPFDGTSTREISPSDLRLIEERRSYLHEEHIRQTLNPRSIHLLSAGARTLESSLWNRELGFGKIALVNRGVDLLDHWITIKRERDIPIGVLAWEVNVTQLINQNWNSVFYSTVFTDEQDETSRELYRGRWIFVRASGVLGFSAITNQEALRFYHRIGGHMPHVWHMSVAPRIVSVAPGDTVMPRVSVSGGVAPYEYSLGFDPVVPWIAVSSGGVIIIAHPGTPTEDRFESVINVTDANGTKAHARLVINVTA